MAILGKNWKSRQDWREHFLGKDRFPSKNDPMFDAKTEYPHVFVLLF